jgi:hypothetical protein
VWRHRQFSHFPCSCGSDPYHRLLVFAPLNTYFCPSQMTNMNTRNSNSGDGREKRKTRLKDGEITEVSIDFDHSRITSFVRV